MHYLLYVQARSLDFVTRGGSLTEELKYFVEKMSFFRQRGGQTGATRAFHRRGAWRRSSQPWTIFRQKIAVLVPFKSYFFHFRAI